MSTREKNPEQHIRTLSRRSLLWMAGSICALSACTEEKGASQQPPAGTASAASKGPPIRMALSAAFVSEAGTPVYQKIADHLGRETGHRFELVTGLGYETISSMLESGALDVAFVCGAPYVVLHDRPQPAANLLVAPIMKHPRYAGQPKYYSDLIVRKDSAFQKLEDLKGRAYAYNEEASNSGYNLPRYRLAKAGYTNGFFGTVTRSGSHEESIRMVATGKADASYVDSLVLEFDQQRGEQHANAVRVIDSVGPAGIPPVVISTKSAPQLTAQIARVLVAMNTHSEGRKILDEALVERFAEVGNENYDDIRQMKRFAEDLGFLKIK